MSSDDTHPWTRPAADFHRRDGSHRPWPGLRFRPFRPGFSRRFLPRGSLAEPGPPRGEEGRAGRARARIGALASAGVGPGPSLSQPDSPPARTRVRDVTVIESRVPFTAPVVGTSWPECACVSRGFLLMGGPRSRSDAQAENVGDSGASWPDRYRGPAVSGWMSASLGFLQSFTSRSTPPGRGREEGFRICFPVLALREDRSRSHRDCRSPSSRTSRTNGAGC